MKKVLLFTFALAIFAFSSMAETWKGISSPQPAPGEIRLVSSDISTSVLQFSLEGYFLNKVTTPRGEAFTISAPKGAFITEKGAPELYKFAQSVIIPDMDRMEITIVDAKYVDYPNITIAPSKGVITRDIDPATVPYTWGSAYEKDGFWPGNIAQLEDPYILRDFRGQTVTFLPFQYNPVTKVLRVYTDIKVEVKTTGQMGENAFVNNKRRSTVSSEYMEIYKTHFANFQEFTKTRYPVLAEEGRMLIISHPAFAPAMKPFIDWKRSIGINTEMVTTTETGTTAAAIKTYVENYYNTHDDFTFLLLIGDAPQVPAMNVSGSGMSDGAYGYLVGTDSYNEIFVGRFSSETVAHVETQVARMITYERDLNASDTWLNVGMGIAKNEGAGNGHNGGEADHVHMNFIRDSLLNYTYTTVHQEYEGVSGIPNTNAATISNKLNQGIGIINFCNHGYKEGWSVANYNITHVNALTNVNKLPFIWSVACVNGDFIAGELCFAEAWLRATDNGQPTGAIGTMMSTINQPWQPPMTGQDEMVTILVEKRDHIKRTFGGLSINGSMKMIDLHGSSGKQTHDTWVLFGDPTLMVRTAAPAPMNLTYNPILFIGAANMVVSGDADGVRITLSYVDDEENVVIVGSAVMEDGEAIVEFEEALTNPGTLTLTAVGFNKITLIDEIGVIPPDGPYVVYKSMQLNDSEGNANGQADYGETITLNITLENVGIEVAEGVQAVLSTENENVQILQNTATWGNIANGNTGIVENAYTIKVNNQIPNNHTVRFNLAITGSGDEDAWESGFSVKIYTPLFTIGNLVVDDATGNNNGRLDPGETAQFKFNLTNNGGAPAQAAFADLMIQSPYITIEESHIDMPVVAAGEVYQAIFNVTAHASIPEGTLYDLEMSVEDAYLETSAQQFVVGQVPVVTIGTGNVDSNQYPFYNYYKANKSQMLYLASEIGPGEKTITDLSFYIKQIASGSTLLPNFVIRMKHVSISAMPSAYVDMTGAVTVFQSTAYQMPLPTANPGWHTWEITPFEYNGTDNIVVEIVWGLLDNWVSTFYKVASTTYGVNRTTYGFSDTQAVPNYNGVTTTCPNIKFGFLPTEAPESYEAVFTVTRENEIPLADAQVKIGTATYNTNASGQVAITLYEGDYAYSASKAGFSKVENQELSLTENKTVIVELARIMSLTFNVIDTWGTVHNSAVVTLNQQAHPAGSYFMENLVAGTYAYTVSAQYFHTQSGEITLEDDDMEVDIQLIADGTSINDAQAASIQVYPNPAKDVLNINLGNHTNAHIQLINIIGETLISVKDASGIATISTQGLPVGTYFVRIMANDKLSVKKISIIR